MKIAFLGLKPWEEEYLKKTLIDKSVDVEPVFFAGFLDKDHLPPATDFELISVFVDSTLNGEVLQKFPNLKFITTRSTGYDHVDLDYCRSKSITVSYVPSYGENTVAEYAFALILTLSRKMYETCNRIKETRHFDYEGLQGFDLKGRILGVLGTGHIGQHAVKIAKGFDMKVIAYDPYPNAQFAKDYGFTYLSLPELLRASDIVTVHVPYMKETHHLLNEETLGFMKKGAYLINTSRGAVLDTDALVKSLQSGHLGGAGLDVLEEEGMIKDELAFLSGGHPEEHSLKTVLEDHVLMNMQNVIITPHNAFNTTEALQRILDTTVENISSFASGTPINLVK